VQKHSHLNELFIISSTDLKKQQIFGFQLHATKQVSVHLSSFDDFADPTIFSNHFAIVIDSCFCQFSVPPLSSSQWASLGCWSIRSLQPSEYL